MELNSRCEKGDLGCRKKKVAQGSTILNSFLHRKPRSHPPLFALRIMRYVRVTHGRQFTGGVFAGVSMQARAVGDDLSILVGQQLRREFFDLFWRNVQRSGKVRFAVAFRRKRLDDLDRVSSV
jgi:hypothetical protein